MTTVNYPNPVMVNGYACKTCTQVDEARKHIDPDHPKDGPFGVLANTQPPNPDDPHQRTSSSAPDQTPAVTFGGALASFGVSPVNGAPAAGSAARAPDGRDPARGRLLDISA